MRSKFTADVRRAILDALMEGNSRETAVALAGIDRSTFTRWLERGRDASLGSQFKAFGEEVEMAEAAARGRALTILNKAMVDQPKWAAWFLERRDPAFRAEQRETPQVQQVVVRLELPTMPSRGSSTIQQLPAG